MSKPKSIVEQALLQTEIFEDALKANAKGIFSLTMKNELTGLLKEMKEEKEVTENVPVVKPEDVAEQTADEEEINTDEKEDVSTEDEPEANELDSDLGDDETNDFSNEETSDEDDLETPDDDEIEDEGDDISDEEDEDVLDMTNASDEEVLKVFKAMKSDDGIVVKKDGNTIELQDGDNDYVIKLGDEKSDDITNIAESSDEEISDEDIYEIELSDDDYEDDVPTEEEIPAEEEFTESARTKGFGYRGGLKSKQVFKSGNKREEINEEVERLKKQNAEYKEALSIFKDKLNEVAVFNANLAYATRLFTEHTTTKQEKFDILKRFDSISTITESKKLYSSIKGELDNKKPMTETVVNKIVSTPKSSTTEILSESKAYENPAFSRTRELMRKLNNK